MNIGVSAPPVTVVRTGFTGEAFRRLAVAVAVVAAMVSGLALVSPVHVVAPGSRAAIETMVVLAATLSAWLFLAEFQRSRRLTDLLLLCALVAVSLADFVYCAVPALAGTTGPELGGSTRLCSNLVVACVFAAAAFAPGTLVPARRGPLVWGAVAAGAGVVALPVLIEAVTGWSLSLPTRSVDGAGVALHPVVLAAYIASAVVLLISGLAFVRRVCRGDTRAGFLAPAAFLLAGARLQYLVIPVVGADWVTPREGLRLGAYAFLLAGAYWQYAKTRHARASAAISSERERIARDLHDGLAQDLACIAAQGQRLDSELEPGHPLMLAARHALATSRGVITDLSASSAPDTRSALHHVADELGYRYGVHVAVRTEPATALSGMHDLGPSNRDDVVRIAREAIVNAALHGAADHVDVVVRQRGRELIMRVSDDGSGIADESRSGLGMQSMRSRAAALGGRLRTRRRIRGGTELELLVP